jgi:hypothetical protein
VKPNPDHEVRRDFQTARLISPQQRNPDANHSLMLLVAGIRVFHLQEGGTGQLGTLTAVLALWLTEHSYSGQTFDIISMAGGCTFDGMASVQILL